MTNNNVSNNDKDNDNEMTTNENRKLKKWQNFIWIIPIINGLMWPLNILIGYFIGIGYDLIDPSIPPPYVSDIASIGRLFAGYFSFIGHILIILFIITIIYLNHNRRYKNYSKRNHQALIVAILATIGTLIWINFRSNQQFIIHSIGICWMYLATSIYMFLMCFLCKKLYDYGQVESKPITMFISTILYVISSWTSVVFFIISAVQLPKFKHILHQHLRLYWPHYIDGYLWHILANICSWIMIFAYTIFIWSIGQRMRRFIRLQND
ncbi:DNA damage-regulated autophagy modulator protein [Dermatophagoides farinae]|uniref:DNA damage-regulated autophagy modulator protein n=1 Tax=Dermatophagoides farinae TaxID=6954 RepID=A0A922HIZ7_DERFA|nr:DNA damage-regulated autophagy modulator protein [Dermatophagoides farinae]